jgi:hypothetical protein
VFGFLQTGAGTCIEMVMVASLPDSEVQTSGISPERK